MSKIGTYFDPVVDQTWRKRRDWKQGRQALFWCFVNVFMALCFYFDMNVHILESLLHIPKKVLWYIDGALIIVFILNFFTNFVKYITPFISGNPVELTPGQTRLLGVKNTDRGFRVSPRKSPSSVDQDGSLIFSPSPTSQSSFSNTSTPRSGRLTPTTLGSFSGSVNYGIPSLSYSTYASPTSSYEKVQNMSALSANASLSHSTSFSPNATYSPSVSFSPSQLMQNSSMDGSGLRSRTSVSRPLKSSPAASASFDRITDYNSLSYYLKEQEEKDYKSALSSADTTASSGASFWNYGRTALDYTHVLKKYMYQLASRSPQSLSTRNNDNDQSTSFGGEDIWIKRGATEDDLYLWVERLRKWMCQTVVTRLAKEIDQINASLRRIGSEDTEIGEVGVSTLKQLALTKGPHVPTLNTIVPYLDFSSNQEYLVKRIKDLGKDGCMSEFLWNGGGHYGKVWGEHLPTDAALVMHLLSTYLDSRLPAQPKFPDGKTFTSQYYVRTPDKPHLDKDDTLCIYQSTINPPHFQVIIGKTIHNLPKGRNNMFQAVLLFLHHIKTKEHGMLGRVNLGMSGVNLLWIFN